MTYSTLSPFIPGSTFSLRSVEFSDRVNTQALKTLLIPSEFKENKHEHITTILLKIHWLPINYRMMFKILLITYKLRLLKIWHLRTFSCDLRITFILYPATFINLKSPFYSAFQFENIGCKIFLRGSRYTLELTLLSDIKNSSPTFIFKTFLFKEALKLFITFYSLLFQSKDLKLFRIF